MKEYLSTLVVCLAILAVALPVRGQQREGARSRRLRNLSPEERAKLRERWQNMSEEERQEARNQLRQRFASRRPDTDLKAALTQLEQQMETLRTQHEQLIAQLREIHQLAVKEEATQTAQRVEKLITDRQEEFANEIRGMEQRQRRLQRAQRQREPRRPRAEETGKKAPQFTLQSFDGKTVSLSDYEDKIVVLEWFNFECPFSRYHYDKVPTMVRLAKKYKDNVVWLAINSTNHTTVEANKEFAEKHGLPYSILDDRSGRVGHAYDAKTTPHMYIIDTRGNIVYEGAIDNAPLGKARGDVVNYVDKALAELVAGKPVSTKETKPYGCTVKYAR
jgi:peroxiredoxin